MASSNDYADPVITYGDWGVEVNGETYRNENKVYSSTNINFGNSVAINDNYMIVCAPIENKGALYIYKRDPVNGWPTNASQKILYNGDGTYFGQSVCMNETYIIVGAVYPNTTGRVFIYEKDENGYWENTVILRPNSNVTGSVRFGDSVAIDGNYIVVGASSDSISSVVTGAAYIFKLNDDGTWGTAVSGDTARAETTRICAANRTTYDGFGNSVAIKGNYIIVGASAEDGEGDSISGAGAAYIFKLNDDGTWGTAVSGESYRTETTILRASNQATNRNFGRGVAINENYIVIGESGGSDVAYIYERDPENGWPTTATTQIRPSDLTSSSFGRSVSIYGNVIIIGAPSNKSGYIFELNNGTWGTAVDGETYRTETTKLSSSGNITEFGWSASVYGTYIGIGARLGNSAFIYERPLITTISPTPLTFTNNILTISNSINSTDTDIISFVLPAGYEMRTLEVTGYNGSGSISYTLSATGKTDITGTFNQVGTNLLEGITTVFAVTDITYTFTFTTTAEETLSYTIEGISAPFNFVTTNYTIEQLLGFGFTMQQIIDGGFWNADPSANRINSSYIDGYLDISGGTTKIRGNLYVGTGTLEQTSQVYNQQPSITNDNSLSGDLFINGNVLFNSPGTLNVTGDISINGFLSVDSYVNGSIPLTALASSGGGGNSGYYVQDNTTIITKEMEYSNPIQVNADISTNTYRFSNFTSPPDAFKPSDAKLTLNLVGGGTTAGNIWKTFDVSDTGEYIIAGVYEGNLWISADYGGTWRELSGASGDYAQVSGATQKWHDVAISGDGSIMMAKWGPVGPVQGILYRSEDYGKTWSTLSYNGITFHEQGDQVANGIPVPFVMSKDGNYIYSYSNPHGVNANYGTNSPVFEAVYSHDGGANWHNVVTTRSWISNIYTSKSGKYVVLGIYGSGPRDDTMVKYSNDYGVTYNILYHLKYPAIIWSASANYFGANVLDSGLFYLSYIETTKPFYRFDLSNAIITPYDASFNISDASYTAIYPAGLYGSGIQIVATEDGMSVGLHTFQNAGQPRLANSVFSGDYGKSFSPNMGPITRTSFYTNNQGTPVNPGEMMKFMRLFKRNNSTYIMYIFTKYLYIGLLEYIKTDSANTLYVGPSTTIKLKQDVSAILLENGSSISSSNIASGSYKNNNVVFRDSSFNNMTVTGAFTSSQLNDPSDYRIKTDIQDLNETHILDNLRPVKFYQTQLGQTQIGFLAHELQEYYPELVDGEKDGAIMQSVNYNGLLAVLIHEVQQLKTRVANRRARNLVA